MVFAPVRSLHGCHLQVWGGPSERAAAYWHGLLEWVGSLFAFKDRPVFLMVEHIYLALVKHLPHREGSRLWSLSSPSSSRLGIGWNANKSPPGLLFTVGQCIPEASLSVRNECKTPRDLRITCWVWLRLQIQTLFSNRMGKLGRRASFWDPFTRAAALRSAEHGGVNSLPGFASFTNQTMQRARKSSRLTHSDINHPFPWRRLNLTWSPPRL